jgi:hypothetical protein
MLKKVISHLGVRYTEMDITMIFIMKHLVLKKMRLRVILFAWDTVKLKD